MQISGGDIAGDVRADLDPTREVLPLRRKVGPRDQRDQLPVARGAPEPLVNRQIFVDPSGQFVEILGHCLQDPPCLLYTSDAADERSSVDLGGRRIITKKTKNNKKQKKT